MEKLKKLGRETIIRAISEIRQNPKKRNGRESTTYDLDFEGEKFPPILVLSEANKLAGGEELTLSDFNNNTDKAFSILRKYDFNVLPKQEESAIQKQLISKYKELIKKDQNKDELFKWELIKEFQEKWDINADDFSTMIQSINFSILLDFRSRIFIKYVDNYPEEARSLFKMLFDEDIPLKKRIEDFGDQAEVIFKKFNKEKSSFQDERTVATYLTFRYPDKYTFYKYSIYSDYVDLLNIKKVRAGERYIHYLELINELIDDHILKDDELINLSRDTLTDDCFVDEKFNILAQDILYRTTQQNDSTSNSEEYVLDFNPEVNNAWIEKTLVRGRPDREVGDYKLGKKLWSPRASSNGADIYKNMREISPGDLILHLTDNKGISGVSIVSQKFVEGYGVEGTEWDGEAYLIELQNFTEIELIDRNQILRSEYKNQLDQISEEHDVFYTRNLKLRQGAYLTECPVPLISIINLEYKKMTESQLPFINSQFDGAVVSSTFSIDNFIEASRMSGLIYSQSLIKRFASSLITKPFLILTGLSGSGKTKLAQAFTEWIIEDKDQLNLVPVGADWTNREPLLGYPNALNENDYVLPDSGVLQLLLRAKDDPNRPYFLILDEMNLSHVERYFADFLSAIESKEEIKLHSREEGDLSNNIPTTIKIPKNLFIIGTVNIDETTYMFSPKVLDRANVIEFRVSHDEMTKFLVNPADVDLDVLRGMGASMAEDFVQVAGNNSAVYSKKDQLADELLKFFTELNTVGAEFGYRSAYEIQRFAALSEQLAKKWTFEDIMDAAIAQKLLPKLHGSRRKLEKVLFKLGDLCHPKTEKGCEELFKKDEKVKNDAISEAKYPISFEKIVRMHKGLVDNGFTSFAEA